MLVYCVAFALAMILAAVFCRKERADNKGLLVWLPVVPILLVSVFRYGIGTDYLWVYDYGYESVVLGRSWNYSRFEPGYLAINFLVSFLHGSSFWVFAIMAVIFHYFMYRFILEWSENVPLSLLVLFVSQQWLFSLSGIRQAAAIAIVAFAIRFAMGKKPVKYFVFIGIAASFHFTALVYAPLYFLLRRRYSQVAVLFLSVFLFAISMAFPNLLQSIADVFGRANYFGSEYSKGRLYITEFAIALLISVIVLAVQEVRPDFDSRYRVLINVSIFSLLVASASASIPNAERFDMYFSAVYIALIPSVCKYFKTQLASLGIAALLIATLGARMVYDTYINGDSNGIADYRCILLEGDTGHL